MALARESPPGHLTPADKGAIEAGIKARMEQIKLHSTPSKPGEFAMLAWFPINSKLSIKARKPFTESDLRGISDILRRTGKETWSKIPRIYSILRIIGQIRVIDDFLADGLSDLWLPFTFKTLPEALKDPSSRVDFLEAQNLVLTKALDLEREDGEHRHFSKEADIPFTKIAELGKGGFGYVDRVLSTISYKEYARKLIPRGRTFKKDQTVLRDFERELANLKRLSHPHIIELVGSYTDPKFVGIIMSPVADCNLREFLDATPLSVENLSLLRTFFGCLTAALCYLHENRIRHKDIIPQNVLVKGHQVFLTDFGISLDWTELGHSTTSGPTIRSPRYCSPEVADDSARNSSSDIWSLGCIFLEMWTVLVGETVAALLAHLEKTDERETRYYLNLSAVKSWCRTIGNKPASAPYQAPRAWIAHMMQLEQQSRWTAQMLLDRIQEVNADEKIKYTFSGLCCLENDDSAESVHSPSESGEPFQINPLADETMKRFRSESTKAPGITPSKPGSGEGNLAEVEDKQISANGEVIDQDGDDIKKVKLVPENFGAGVNWKEISNFPKRKGISNFLDRFQLSDDGEIIKENGKFVAKLAEGNLADAKAHSINEKGEVFDMVGNIIGVLKLNHEPFGLNQEQFEYGKEAAHHTAEGRARLLHSAEAAASVASQPVVSLESDDSSRLPTFSLTDRAKSHSPADERRKSQASQQTVIFGKSVEAPERTQEQLASRPIAPKLSQNLERIRVRAKYAFTAQGPGEASVKVGDKLRLLDLNPENGWWMIRRVEDNSQGVVPETYIEIMDDDVDVPSPLTIVEGPPKGRALYNFTAEAPDELTVKEGDTLVILNNSESDEWWQAQRLSDGSLGIVPASYIEMLDDPKRDDRVPSAAQKEREKPPPNKVRVWTDRTKSFRVEGALIGFRNSKVHIHKINGVKIAVPVEQLSTKDLEYVESITGRRVTPLSIVIARTFSS